MPMLNIIDTFLVFNQKYVWSKSLIKKKKNGIDVPNEFEYIIRYTIEIGHKSPNLLCDVKDLDFKS